MSTPINQLPPGQPVANDPQLVQQILKEYHQTTHVQGEQNNKSVSEELHESSHKNMLPLVYHSPIKQTQYIDYTSIIKNIIMVFFVSFLSHVSTFREMLEPYVPNNANLLVRCLLAGIGYAGLTILFS